MAELKKQATVYVPVDNDGLTQFAVWEEGTEPALDKNTIISPKKIFFPQTEELYAYETKKLQAAVQELDGVGGPTVVVGIRPCDVKAIELLDDVFSPKVLKISITRKAGRNGFGISRLPAAGAQLFLQFLRRSIPAGRPRPIS